MPNIPDQRQELIRVLTGLQIITVTTQPGSKLSSSGLQGPLLTQKGEPPLGQSDRCSFLEMTGAGCLSTKVQEYCC